MLFDCSIEIASFKAFIHNITAVRSKNATTTYAYGIFKLVEKTTTNKTYIIFPKKYIFNIIFIFS